MYFTKITIFANATKAGYISGLDNIELTVEPKSVSDLKFNLRIRQDDITFSNSEQDMNPGDVVTIFANITNIGPDDATGFTVRFIMDGNQIGEDIQLTSLGTGKTILVTLNCTVTEGNFSLQVVIVPVEIDFETDSAKTLAGSPLILNLFCYSSDSG